MKILNGGTFVGCTSLYKIIIPGNVEKIMNTTYGYYVNYTDYLTYYGTFAYSGVKEVIIEEGVKIIGNFTFHNCKDL